MGRGGSRRLRLSAEGEAGRGGKDGEGRTPRSREGLQQSTRQEVWPGRKETEHDGTVLLRMFAL